NGKASRPMSATGYYCARVEFGLVNPSIVTFGTSDTFKMRCGTSKTIRLRHAFVTKLKTGDGAALEDAWVAWVRPPPACWLAVRCDDKFVEEMHAGGVRTQESCLNAPSKNTRSLTSLITCPSTTRSICSKPPM